mmetsp:Transcript_2760/g.4115  ORF Transcript_2760/g.4115 Transcript_2760/m.4115 type:complete len:170 (+) Transcript_2760:341-850(+)|eukprot:CAMPEP_0194201400 /NCGR_PEP_ID=MMETSP0156-20130528/1672_1 /TAXON_ID=33649 /ORGANISM="Thalassionema nitzschioides, Strain L26-B" /LENGTH=169 /DNA_ID=CAMNT_0038926577 /DNA_START=348 /DNA_END=857 /DNA_ORIENTATION=+
MTTSVITDMENNLRSMEIDKDESSCCDFSSTAVVDVTKVDDLLMEIMGFTDFGTLLRARKVNHRWEELTSIALDRKAASPSEFYSHHTKQKKEEQDMMLFHQMAVSKYNSNNTDDANAFPIIGSYVSYTARPPQQQEHDDEQQQQPESRDDLEVGVLLSYNLPSVSIAA